MAQNPGLLKAFALINKTNAPADADTPTPTVLPTAKSRAALNLLTGSTPDKLTDMGLRPLLQDIFNWDGKNHVNKPLIRAFEQAVNTPRRYPQAVEFTAYAAALAPLLEADQIARMYEAVPETSTAFGPNLYTLGFSRNVKNALTGLSPTRVEKIALSLWKEAHNGRWWNITAGIQQGNEENQEEMTGHATYKALLDFQHEFHQGNTDVPPKIAWSPHNQEAFRSYMENRLDENIALLSEDIHYALLNHIPVNADVAVFLSCLDWLAPTQRPESPINSILVLLTKMRQDENFKMPKKPNSIADIFPAIDLRTSSVREFLMDDTILAHAAPGGSLYEKIKAETNGTIYPIVSKAQLGQNARYMGNCTVSFMDSMNDGHYILYRIDFPEDSPITSHNLSMVMGKKNGTWTVGEIQGRHNRNQNATVNRIFREFVANLPPSSPYYIEAVNNSTGDKRKSVVYRYTIA